MQRNRGKQQNGKDYRSLEENQRYQGNISCKMGLIKDRNGMDLTEAEDIKKRWQEYAEELCKKEKWLSEETLQIPVKRREAKSKGGKER